QKGLDILCEAAPELAKRDLVLVILGSGEKKYQDLVERIARNNPGRIAARVGFDNRMAHLMEAGSDMLLMPSRYEPCGLNQIYSLRYGTIPVVRATGGLDDTVKDLTADPAEGNGFKFRKYTARDLVRKVDEAVKAFGDKKAWREVQKRAMREDFSWRNSASQYMDLYRKVLAPAPPGPKAAPAGPKPVVPPPAGGKPPSGGRDG
ncbi:MAG TPA: glycosyltransferase, partial [Gammaproteobacteria bacterium]|nr:glycosyltransferase [Gammaproteobacteria bacterium]